MSFVLVRRLLKLSLRVRFLECSAFDPTFSTCRVRGLFTSVFASTSAPKQNDASALRRIAQTSVILPAAQRLSR